MMEMEKEEIGTITLYRLSDYDGIYDLNLVLKKGNDSEFVSNFLRKEYQRWNNLFPIFLEPVQGQVKALLF